MGVFDIEHLQEKGLKRALVVEGLVGKLRVAGVMSSKTRGGIERPSLSRRSSAPFVNPIANQNPIAQPSRPGPIALNLSVKWLLL